MDIWDTIVIGAGVGGLTAAATLVNAGKHVLVVEKNPHVGGTAYVYRRNGFTFPMGPLGFSNPGKITEHLKELNTFTHFSCDRIHYRFKALNLDFILSLPFSDVSRKLSYYFPNESAAIQQFFQDVEEYIISSQSFSRANKTSLWSRLSNMSMQEYLDDITSDQRLQCILGSLGTRKPYASFPLQAAMWNIMCREGIWYPRGGFASFCNHLAKAVTGPYHDASTIDTKINTRSTPGVIRLGTEVKKISVDGDRVTGVILADGSLIRSTSVISNADFKSTFLKLLDSGVTPGWQNAVSEAKQTGSVIQVCLGVDSAKVDLSTFNKASRIIYRRNHGDTLKEAKVDWHDENITTDAFVNQEIEVSCWSEDDGHLAPLGSSVIVLRVEAPYDHFAQFHLGWRARAPIYPQYKFNIAHAIINEMKGLLPGLEQGIIVTDIATPITFEDQGGRSQGAVAGWSWNYEDSNTSNPDALITTPVLGLYMAGYQAFSALSLGGIPTAMESGSLAARAVLEHAEPAIDIRIPGNRKLL